jgi:two-component system, NarL family, response regulator NreC
MDEIRVLLADDHTLVRKGLRALLERDPRIRIVDEAGDGHEAVSKAERTVPDVIVMDIGMPNLNGIETTRRIRSRLPAVRIVILTMHASEEYMKAVIDAGASAYVLKQSAPSELSLAIEAAVQGHMYLSPAICSRVVDEYRKTVIHGEDKSGFDALTVREREVLQMIAEGKPVRKIAEALFISPKTVETHRAHLMEKLELHNTVEIVRFAVRKGIVGDTDPSV